MCFILQKNRIKLLFSLKKKKKKNLIFVTACDKFRNFNQIYNSTGTANLKCIMYTLIFI